LTTFTLNDQRYSPPRHRAEEGHQSALPRDLAPVHGQYPVAGAQACIRRGATGRHFADHEFFLPFKSNPAGRGCLCLAGHRGPFIASPVRRLCNARLRAARLCCAGLDFTRLRDAIASLRVRSAIWLCCPLLRGGSLRLNCTLGQGERRAHARHTSKHD
jgi:hypothetical protein